MCGHGRAVSLFTLGAHAQRGYGSWVCVCVCVSALHLTSRMFVRFTNDTTYLTGNEGQKFRTVFSENAPLQRFHHRVVAILSLRMRIISSKSHFEEPSNSMVVYTNAPNQLVSKRQSIAMDMCMCKFL